MNPNLHAGQHTGENGATLLTARSYDEKRAFQSATLAGQRTQVAQSRLAMLVEHASGVIVGISPDGLITDWNRAAAELLHQPVAEALGRPWTDFVPAEERSCEETMLHRAFVGESSPAHESRRLRADGTTAAVIVSTFPHCDASGRGMGATQIVLDVSALSSLDAQLDRAQRSAAQDMLAAMVCHDVSNSLGVALGLATLHREQNKTDSVTTTQLDAVLHAIRQAGAICDQFRQQSWGTRELRVIDLAAAVKENFSMLGGLEECKLGLKLPSQPLPVRANETLIGEVLVNLVLNARAAIRRDGHITVRARAEGRAAGEVHVLEVEDDGAGVPVEVQRDLSRAFFGRKTQGRGMGLGLASVLMLTKEMGGELEIDSEAGRGTRMRVVLPSAVVGQKTGGHEDRPTQRQACTGQ